MGSLIKNEFIKIFKKKSTYVVLIILFLFVILTNTIYLFIDKLTGGDDYRTSEQYISFVKEQLKTMDVNTNRTEYIDYQTDLDYYELQKNYDKDSWQMFIIERDFTTYLHNLNLYKYGTDADRATFLVNPDDEYKKALEKLNNSDWKDYVQEEIEQTEAELSELKEQKKLLEGMSSGNKELDGGIEALETKLSLLKMRIEKNIPYGNDYINKAIQTRIMLSGLDYNYNEPNMSHQEKIASQEEIENYEKSKYIIDTRQDINNQKSVRSALLSVFDEYSIFIMIFVIMIAGGIVSSELEKGTIKILLVKPYKRWKILTAKYIVSMLMILFIFAVTVVFATLVGGIFFGFKSLSIPAVVYNFNTNSLQTYNIFVYVLIMAINKLPMYILLGTLAFAISSIFGNTVLAVVLPIIGNIASSIINAILNIHPIKQLSIFPTLNWDLSQFLFGKLPLYEYTNFGFALFVCIAYWLIMICASYTFFNKKEIKNI